MKMKVGWDKKGRGQQELTLSKNYHSPQGCVEPTADMKPECQVHTCRGLPSHPASLLPLRSLTRLINDMYISSWHDDFLHVICFLTYSAKNSLKTELEIRKAWAERQLTAKFSWLGGKQHFPHCATPKMLAFECQPCQGTAATVTSTRARRLPSENWPSADSGGSASWEEGKVIDFQEKMSFSPSSWGVGGIHKVRHSQCFEQTSFALFKLETVTDKDIFHPAVCSGLSLNSISNAVHCLKSLCIFRSCSQAYLQGKKQNADSICELCWLGWVSGNRMR